MFNLFILILVSFLLGNQIAIYSKPYSNVLLAIRQDAKARFLFIILCFLLIIFSGFRTTYNDTQTYIYDFYIFDTSKVSFTTLFEPYGGFDILRWVVKTFISSNPQSLILISAIISNLCYLWFIAKYSKYFGWTILGYFILGPYMFSMAGIKQILAMSISLFGIDKLIQRKYMSFIIWILFSMIFHPYICCMLILPMFTEQLWSKKFLFILILSILIVININFIMSIASIIGKDYTVSELTTNTVNPLRVVVESIPIILSLIGKEKLKNLPRQYQLGLNMMIFNFIMIFMGLFFDPIYFARMGIYFTSMNAIIFPILLIKIYENSNLLFNLYGYYFIYCVYFVLDLTQLGKVDIFYDIFHHTNSLF